MRTAPGHVFGVFGLDLTVTFAAEGGQLQLNPFEPVIYWSIDEGVKLLVRGMDMLAEHCVAGIEAHEGNCHANLQQSTALATELVPQIGYGRAAAVAVRAQEMGTLLGAVEALELSLPITFARGLWSRPLQQPLIAQPSSTCTPWSSRTIFAESSSTII